MKYIADNQTKKLELKAGSILQSNSNSEVYMIVNTNTLICGKYALMNLKDDTLYAYNNSIYELVDDNFGSYTILVQDEPIKLAKEGVNNE
jgi:ABC-type antimicrobial peptide transport system permease subunit